MSRRWERRVTEYASPRGWQGPAEALAFTGDGIRACLMNLAEPCHLVRLNGRLAATNHGTAVDAPRDGIELLAAAPPISAERLGSAAFRAAHRVRYAYAAGAMANGIASEAMVIALGRQRLLSSFGAAGLVPTRVEAAIRQIQAALPQGPYAFNLIHSPSEESIERRGVELYLRYGVRTIEASAFLNLTPTVVRYRVAGLSTDPAGRIVIGHRVIAKVSRREVAEPFLRPAPPAILAQLVSAGEITPRQAELAARVPMCDDLTVEADSGGHTDNRPLVSLLPSLLLLRDQIQAELRYAQPVRIGAAGGIGTPDSAFGAFAMGADYVVTGSINQSCHESGASPHSRELLAQADVADVMMAPAADMFEMGVKVQVLKKGTLFAVRAQKLYDLYRAYDGIEALPAAERASIERQIFRRNLDEVWEGTRSYFAERDPEQVQRAEANPRRKMALVFRWYLGLSSRWSNAGEAGRELDYQIWCGPSMGAFNAWVRGTYLEPAAARSVTDVAEQLMFGAAYQARIMQLRLQGVPVPAQYARYMPQPFAG
jgi:trans-AT polyketide synthase/acyltransferase/oxidoreductase domain-containing protein